MFVAKYDTHGMCQWSTILSAGYVDIESLHLVMNNEELYVSTAGIGIQGSTTLSGANIHNLRADTGVVRWTHHTSTDGYCKFTSLKFIDGQGPVATGVYKGSIQTKPGEFRGDHVGDTVSVESGMFVGTDVVGATMLFGNSSSVNPSTYITSVTNYESGDQLILGEHTGEVNVNTQRRPGMLPGGNNKQTYSINYEL